MMHPSLQTPKNKNPPSQLIMFMILALVDQERKAFLLDRVRTRMKMLLHFNLTFPLTILDLKLHNNPAVVY
jgi:hypothetical protein